MTSHGSYFIRKGHPGVVLAPMEGVTDAPMRALLTEKGPYLFCVTEFLRVTDLPLPKKVFFRDVPELKSNSSTPCGTPVIVQLLGGNPFVLAESAKRAVSLGARGIDLNFGCPAPTVNRHDGGATLLKYPKRLFEIVSTVRQALPSSISVSAKLRLGWEKPDDIFENAEQVCRAGASWITVHARTRTQGYAPPVFWDRILKVKELISIPVVANGDIWNFDDFLMCLESTGCEHFMIGRGAVGNPWLAKQISDYLLTQQPNTDPFSPCSLRDWAPLCKRFAFLSSQHSLKPEYVTRRIKQWVKMASLEREIPWFDTLKRCQNLEETFTLFTEDLISSRYRL